MTAANVNLVTRSDGVFNPGDTSVETLVEAIRSRGYGRSCRSFEPAWLTNRPRRSADRGYNDLRRGDASGALGAVGWFSPCH